MRPVSSSRSSVFVSRFWSRRRSLPVRLFPSKRGPVPDPQDRGAVQAENLLRLEPEHALVALAKALAAVVTAGGAADDGEVMAIGVLRPLCSAAVRLREPGSPLPLS